jgi:hypothetical protein
MCFRHQVRVCYTAIHAYTRAPYINHINIHHLWTDTFAKFSNGHVTAYQVPSRFRKAEDTEAAMCLVQGSKDATLGERETCFVKRIPHRRQATKPVHICTWFLLNFLLWSAANMIKPSLTHIAKHLANLPAYFCHNYCSSSVYATINMGAWCLQVNEVMMARTSTRTKFPNNILRACLDPKIFGEKFM